MGFLSPYIAALAKKKKKEGHSLIKKEKSCGIFQDYGDFEEQAADSWGESR
ncbi:MAG: hypothetical protein AAGA86_01735 [Bacteroidota bacterium]